MAETMEQDVELTLEQKTKLANTIKGMKRDGVPDEVIQASVLNIKEDFQKKNAKTTIINNIVLGKKDGVAVAPILPEVKVEGGDVAVDKGTISKTSEDFVDHVNRFTKPLNIDVSENLDIRLRETVDVDFTPGKSTWSQDSDKDKITVNNPTGNVKYGGEPVEGYLMRKIEKRMDDMDNDPEIIFDKDLYYQSQEKVHKTKNATNIMHPIENRHLKTSELNTEQLINHRNNTYTNLMIDYQNSDGGKVLWEKLQPEIDTRLTLAVEKIDAQLRAGNISREDAIKEVFKQKDAITIDIFTNNDEYQLVAQTNQKVILGQFDFEIAAKTDNDFAGDFYPWYVDDSDVFKGIYKNATVSFPKAMNTLRNVNLSKKHRNLLQNLEIIDDYKIGGDELLLANPYTTKKQPHHSKEEKRLGKIFFSGINFSTKRKKILKDEQEYVGQTVNNFQLPSGYYDKQELKEKLKDLERRYLMEMLDGIAKDQKYQATLDGLGHATALNKRFEFTMSIDDWQQELGTQLFNSFAGIFTGGLYTFGIENAGAYEHLH